MKCSIFFAFVLLTTSPGCDRSDGDRLARVGRKVANKVEALVPEKTPFGSSLPLIKSGIDVRVQERFHSDVFLSPIQFEISVEGANIRLKGMVDDDVLKKRALEIAESTVGVEKVIDEVTVGK